MNWKIILAILTANVVIMSASYTMLIPFLPMYLTRELGVASTDVNVWSSIVFSSTFVVSAVMAPIWGGMADKRGKRAMAIRAALFLAIAYFLGGVVTSPLQLTLVRIFQGFAAGLWPMELAIMSLYAPTDKLGFCLGTMQGALTAGQVLGPLVGGALAELVGMRASFFVAALFLVCNCLTFVFIIKEPAVQKQPEITTTPAVSSWQLWCNPLIRKVLCYAVFVQMVLLILQPILTPYIASLAGDIPNLMVVSGFVFSLSGFASVLSAPLWGRFGQHHGFFLVLTITMAGAGVAMVVQGIPHSLYAFAIMQFIVGLFFAGIHPSLNSILATHTVPAMKGRIFGMMFSAQQIGSIIGPLLGGIIATFWSTMYVFFVAGVILLTLSIVVTYQKKPTAILQSAMYKQHVSH